MTFRGVNGIARGVNLRQIKRNVGAEKRNNILHHEGMAMHRRLPIPGIWPRGMRRREMHGNLIEIMSCRRARGAW